MKSIEGEADSADTVEQRVRTRGGRFEFLDALRGLAALAVVIEHFTDPLWPSYSRFIGQYFNFGVFGVFAFFIVSGYIIPASLERGRSLGSFWVGRFFRLFPLFWVFLIAAVVLHYVGMYGGPPGFMVDPVWNLATNATMAHLFLVGHYSEILIVAWTLSYELVFYAFVSLLFLGGLNRRSVPVACLAIGAIPGAALFLPTALVGGPGANLATRLTVAAVTVVVAVVFGYRAANRGGSAGAAVLIAVLAVPLVLNQPGASGYSVAIFATMFVGTVLYRMTSGEISAWLGWGVFGIAVCLLLAPRFVQQPVSDSAGAAEWGGLKGPAFTIVAAYLLFAVMLLLRRYSFPRPLLFLGRISFSLYLVHGLVNNAVPKWPESVFGGNAAWLTWCTWMVVAIGLATLSYNKIEQPLLRVGHRLMAKMDARARPVPAPIA
ncbi:acyltransferase family protein [Nocardia sp. NPDC055053]